MLSDYSICIVNNKLLFAYFDYFLLGGVFVCFEMGCGFRVFILGILLFRYLTIYYHVVTRAGVWKRVLSPTRLFYLLVFSLIRVDILQNHTGR